MVVHCTWEVSDGRELANAVLWSSAEDDQSDVEDEVQAENCLLLMAPSAGSSDYLTVPACQLLISCQHPQQIQHISVLSEARILEIYGHHGEYIKTVRNELLEEVDEMAVFKGDVTFDRPLNICSIKFACLRSKNEMWLYGVKVKFSKAEGTPDSPVKIPFAEVEQRLQDMGLTLSEKAECFKQLMECQQQGFLPKLTPEDLVAFVQAVKSGTNGTASKATDSASVFAAAAAPDSGDASNRNIPPIQPNVPSSSPTPSSVQNNNITTTFHCTSTQTEGPLPPGHLDMLKAHVDEKLKELDEKLWDRIQKRFAEIETKLMCKMDEVESFVKPQGVKPQGIK